MSNDFAPPSGDPINPKTSSALPDTPQDAPPSGEPIKVAPPVLEEDQARLAHTADTEPSNGEKVPIPSGQPVAFPVPAPQGEPVVLPSEASQNESAPLQGEAPQGEPEILPIEAPQGEPVVLPTAEAEQAPAGQPVILDETQQPLTPSAPQSVPAPAVPAQATSPAPEQKKKKSKKPLIIALVAVLAVILVVVGVLVFQEVSRSNAYNEATQNFEQGNYALAEEGFEALGEYKDAQSMCMLANNYKVYEEAKTLYDEGWYEDAQTMFEALTSSSIDDIDEWIQKCRYALANELYEAGDLTAARDAFDDLGSYSDSVERVKAIRYEMADAYLAEGDVETAYNIFTYLGDYSDAADRATACTQPFPASGILYQAEGTYYAYAAIEINYNYSSGGSFFKIYNGDTLVASLFCNANSTVRVYLNPGNYTIKEGTGDIWFGPELAFGTKGSYSTMTYDDTGTDYIGLNDTDLVTITINSGTTGNVSERGEDLSSF